MRPERDNEGSKKIFLPKAAMSDTGRTDALSPTGAAKISGDVRSLKKNAATTKTNAGIAGMDSLEHQLTMRAGTPGGYETFISISKETSPFGEVTPERR